MNNQTFSPISQTLTLFKRNALILVQFFLIIFVYHTMKDLKDSIVITASDAGAEVIPFIKIWTMLPLAIGASYLFGRIYNRYGREKTLYLFVTLLAASYVIFAFFLHPLSDRLYLSGISETLRNVLPSGCKGFIAMIAYWHYTLFYLAAELWSILILSILFWGYVNSISTLDAAKKFYPLCMFVGNFAGIISGQVSHYLSSYLSEITSWSTSIRVITSIVVTCCIIIMWINRILSIHDPKVQTVKKNDAKSASFSFKDNLCEVFQSPTLFCITVLVVGFGLTSSLTEVIWKESIRNLYPSPSAYNAYINTLTSLIGFFAICMAIVSRWLCKHLNWTKIALITPTTLFTTSSLFFASMMLPDEKLTSLAAYFSVSGSYLIVFLGSIHYVLGLTAKYTIFDSSKEMAFLSLEADKLLRAKSVIDSIGSRLGKSGASCLYQFLLVVFGSTSGHISIIGISTIAVIGISIITTKKLGHHLDRGEEDGAVKTRLGAEQMRVI